MKKQIPLSYYQWAIDTYEEPATINTNELLEPNPEESKKEVRQDQLQYIYKPYYRS